MLPTPIFTAVVHDGMILVDRKEEFKALKDSLEKKRVDVILREHFDKRSLNSNAYLHGVVFECISDATGFETEEVKVLMKFWFLSHYDRRGRLHVRGTHTLNRREMSEFIERCTRWAAVWLDCYIPPPQECEASYAA